MQSLPSEIKNNIVEFGGGQYPLKLSDQELIGRIKIYDPSFDIKRWRNNVALKRDTLKKVLTPELKVLYQYIRDKKVIMCIKLGDIVLIRPNSQEDIKDTVINISTLISKVGYNIKSIVKWLLGSYEIHVNSSRQLLLKLIILWVLERPERGMYNYTINKMQREGIGRIIPRIDVLDTPLTLARYLRYVMTYKGKHLGEIEGSKLYPLYTMLQKYVWKWKINKKTGENTIKIYDIQEGDIPTHIRDEIEKHFPIEDMYYDPKKIYEITSNSNLQELERIDRFFHPYTPYFLQCLE